MNGHEAVDWTELTQRIEFSGGLLYKGNESLDSL
jgi:hypothetical protein